MRLEGGCVVVSGILEGGPVDRTGQIDLGDIVVEAGGAPIQSVDGLHHQVAQPWTKITLLVKYEKGCNFLLRKKDRVIEEIQGKLDSLGCVPQLTLPGLHFNSHHQTFIESCRHI